MDSSIIFGKLPVKNALIGNRKIKTIYMNRAHKDDEILSLAASRGVSIKFVSNDELNRLSQGLNHQGVLCTISLFAYSDLDKVLTSLEDEKDSTILMLDGIEDPVNFGSMIRTSCAFGVDAIIIGKHRQVQVTPTVSKIATGGEEIIPIIQVTNLSQTIQKLKDKGYWIVTSAGEGKDAYDEIDYSGKICLIIGSEGFGVSTLTRKNSDFIASIPLPGSVKALNASIAAAIFIAHIESYRKHKNKI